MVCDACGQELRVGDFPWCPHGKASGVVVGDDIPGGQWFENGFDTPQKFYSHSEHRAALAARGCEIRPKWVPGDKYLTRWDAVDLEGATALVSRGKPTTKEQAAREFPITVTRYKVES
jgi:hypothetical protein